MIRLALIRHAKSSWDEPGLSDALRPLNARGWRTAPRVGARLAALGWVPDLVVSSNAVRALQTWEAMSGALPPTPLRIERALYMGGPTELRAICAALPDDVRTLWAIGHNPGHEEAAAALCGHAAAIKTADVVRMTSDAASWAEAMAPGAPWSLVDHLVAREA